MAEVSLKTLRRVLKSIQSSGHISITPSLQISFQDDYDIAINVGRTKIQELLQSSLDQVDLQYVIRNILDQANHKFGISELITRLNSLQQRLNRLYLFKDFQGCDEHQEKLYKREFEFCVSQIAAGKELGYGRTTFNRPQYMSQQFSKDIENMIKQCKSEIDTITDQLLARNSNNMVELSEQLMERIQPYL